MVTANGTHAVLVDLGVAQLADDVDGKLTRTRQVVGTLALRQPAASPGGRATRPANATFTAWGVTLWELLTLHPFLGATDDMPEPVLMEKIQHDEPTRVRSFHPQFPSTWKRSSRNVWRKIRGGAIRRRRNWRPTSNVS